MRRPLFIVAALAVAACGAILGIEDRFLEPTGDAGDASTEGSSPREGGGGETSTGKGDAGFDVLVIPDAACDPAACAAINGACNGACVIPCAGAACDGMTITCPANTDCQLVCAGAACNNTRCTGGRSCTIECTGTASCYGVACESDTCRLNCTGVDACKDGLVACDAGRCLVDCSGEHSCESGVAARGETTCSIRCTGVSSCGGGGLPAIACSALDASILCGAVTDTCKDGIPRCSGAHCTVTCLPPDSCEDGYCCDASVCELQGGKTPTPSKLCN